MRRTVAVAGIVLAIAAGCAEPSNQAGGAVSPSSTDSPSTGPSSPAPSSVPPASPPPRTQSATPPPGAGQVTLRGRVEEGVEAGCTVLRADNGTTYLLVGADPAIAAPGARVEVVGDLRMDIFTICQQGTPVAVSSVRRI